MYVRRTEQKDVYTGRLRVRRHQQSNFDMFGYIIGAIARNKLAHKLI